MSEILVELKSYTDTLVLSPENEVSPILVELENEQATEKSLIMDCTCASSCGSNYSRNGSCPCSVSCGSNYSR